MLPLLGTRTCLVFVEQVLLQFADRVLERSATLSPFCPHGMG